MNEGELEKRIASELQGWQAWLPKWKPPTHRGRTRVCKRCTGSPIATAAGFDDGVPHQVIHALLTRMHRVIDSEVDLYTREHLPMLQNELDSVELWKSGGYDPRSGMPEEAAGMDPDLLYEEGEHPVLFTFAELEEASKPDAVLPLPPLSEEEKQQLRKEIQLADVKASQIGQSLCFLLASHKETINDSVVRFVEPQIQNLLDELSRSLETPNN